jgi:fumarylacetoacetase
MRSWVHGADESGFGLDNLPYGLVRRAGEQPLPAVRIGDFALPLASVLDGDAFWAPTLEPFIALGTAAWADARRHLVARLTDQAASQATLLALDEIEVLLPVEPGDYVDFYASLEHATTVGRLFRPEGDPLPPNWRHVPLGYHGRSGTVVVSGTPIRRPSGLRGPGDAGPERRLDFELELGIVAGAKQPFGVVLLNDWSAREIQAFETHPLGPFLGKSFATSISAWIVPLELLNRVPPPPQEPAPVAHLLLDSPGALDVELEVAVNGTVVTRGNARTLYWTVEQLLAHAASNGATIRPGDLFGTGTVSGFEDGTQGCLLERGGPFLEDGDEVVVSGRSGAIALGEVRGTVVPG